MSLYTRYTWVLVFYFFFLTQSDILSLLIVLFNQFKFNVIRDILGFMSISLLFNFYVSSLFVPLSLTIFFLH